MKLGALALVSLLMLGLSQTEAALTLPAIFGDHMVLQQDTRLPVWGWAKPGTTVKVTVGEQAGEATTGADGRWRVELPPLPAGSDPVTLTVKADDQTITFQDVLIGDVWICSGQSNMLFGLGNSLDGKKVAKAADHPSIRLFFVTKAPRAEPSETPAAAPPDSPLQGKWQVCTPETVLKIGDFTDASEGGFSAVGYYFAKAIHESTGRPVGMIGSYVGATDAEAWVSLAGLKKEPALNHHVQKLSKLTADEKQLYSIEWADYVTAFRQWKATMEEPTRQWQRDSEVAQKAGQPPPPKPINPEPRPRNHNSFRAPPTTYFNGMIHPLIPYAIKGVIWYQGENNTGRSAEYRTLLTALIRNWRAHWGQGDFPFLIVQLPSATAPPQSAGAPANWALLREAQFQTLAEPHTGLAVTIDIGAVDLHPPFKRDIGTRLALAARRVAYGEKLTSSGPIFDSIKIDGGTVRVTFRPDSIGGGLKLSQAPWRDAKSPLVSADKLEGFALAGEDQQWVWADAKIDGQTVAVSSPEVPNPVAVRYAWANNPVCNLYNTDGLPAAPFRSDSWKSDPAKK